MDAARKRAEQSHCEGRQVKACHKVRATERKGFVPERYHFPVSQGPVSFGWLSRTYAKDGLLVRTSQTEAQHANS